MLNLVTEGKVAYNGPQGSIFFKIPMSYKSGASYNSPGHIRRPSAHTQSEADIWGGEQIYICSADMYGASADIVDFSPSGQNARCKEHCANVHLLQHSLMLANMKQAHMLQATLV